MGQHGESCADQREEPQLDNDRHFMFVSLLTLAIFAFFVGEANNMALNERSARQENLRIKQIQP